MNSENNNILFQFGPLHGNVEKQEIHYKQPESFVEETTEKEDDINTLKTLSIGQLVILFGSLFNLTLDASFTNQSQLSDLISRVSGKSSQSIRQKVMELAKMDSYTKQVKIDAELIAKLIEKLNPQLSREIRDLYID